MKPCLFSIFLFMLPDTFQAQDKDLTNLFRTYKSTDLLVGINWQGNTRENITSRYYEIGLAKARYIFHHHGITGSAVYVSEEMHFNGDQNIFGTKLGAWAHWLLDAGMAIVYYTDFSQGNLKIRPELGVGMGRLRMVMGYNIPTINNRKFAALRRNDLQISMQYAIGLKKREVEVQ